MFSSAERGSLGLVGLRMQRGDRGTVGRRLWLENILERFAWWSKDRASNIRRKKFSVASNIEMAHLVIFHLLKMRFVVNV